MTAQADYVILNWRKSDLFMQMKLTERVHRCCDTGARGCIPVWVGACSFRHELNLAKSGQPLKLYSYSQHSLPEELRGTEGHSLGELLEDLIPVSRQSLLVPLSPSPASRLPSPATPRRLPGNQKGVKQVLLLL